MTPNPKAAGRNPYTQLSASLVRVLSRLRDQHPDATITQAICLFLIAGSPGIAQRDLYRLMGTTDSAASRIVAMLSDIGSRNTPGMDLVSMAVNPEDRRERHLTLTAKGRRLMDDITTDLKRMLD